MVRCLRLAVLLLFFAGVSRADVLDDWNNALLDSIRTENTHPCVAARALAIVHGAMYDTSAAVHRIEGFFQIENVPAGLPLAPALNSAAYCTATNLFPSRMASFQALYEKWMKDSEEAPRSAEALRLGRSVADAWITWRGNDGSSGSLPYIPRKEPGAWRRTPPFVRPPEMYHWARVTPFTLVSAAQFRPPGPPELSTARYAEEVNALKELGGAQSSKRTAEQTETARFWSDFSYTVTPPGHWNEAAQAVAAARKMPLEAKVKLFAALNITMSDAAIACWDSKYFYNFWRPVTAIRAADSDGNSATEPDPDWMPLLNTPAFPEYVPGHSAFSGAAAVVLAHFNGGDKIRFTISSDSLPGKTRSYESLWTCAEEVSQSRLYGGIHFPSGLKDGLELGRRIAQHSLDLFFGSTQPGIEKVFIAPGELHSSSWVGVAARDSRSLTIEARTEGDAWVTWTNGFVARPVTRWRLSEQRDAAEFRVKSN